MKPTASLTPRYAFGILRNRFPIRPAQKEPIIRWIAWLHEIEKVPIGQICEMCATCDSPADFYNNAKQLAAAQSMKKDAGRRWMRRRWMQWPRGRYNGRRITGIEVRLVWRCDLFDWLPTAKWNYGEPFFIWLGFQIRVARTFHYSD